MDFALMDSVRSYVKSLDMLTKWQNKKLTGNFTSQSEKTTSGVNQNETNKSDSGMMDKIRSKLLQGQKLTAEEMTYLQQNSPLTYQSVKKLEAEQKAYERELKKCSTKEDVEKLRISKLSSSLSTIRSVSNNPNIPEGQKLAICTAELQRVNALQKVTNDFVKSGEYAKLPDEAEKNAESADNAAEKEQTEAISDAKTDAEVSDDTAEKAIVATEDKTETSKPEMVKPSDSETKTENTDKTDKNQADRTKRNKARNAYMNNM